MISSAELSFINIFICLLSLGVSGLLLSCYLLSEVSSLRHEIFVSLAGKSYFCLYSVWASVFLWLRKIPIFWGEGKGKRNEGFYFNLALGMLFEKIMLKMLHVAKEFNGCHQTNMREKPANFVWSYYIILR